MVGLEIANMFCNAVHCTVVGNKLDRVLRSAMLPSLSIAFGKQSSLGVDPRISNTVQPEQQYVTTTCMPAGMYGEGNALT